MPPRNDRIEIQDTRGDSTLALDLVDALERINAAHLADITMRIHEVRSMECPAANPLNESANAEDLAEMPAGVTSGVAPAVRTRGTYLHNEVHA